MTTSIPIIRFLTHALFYLIVATLAQMCLQKPLLAAAVTATATGGKWSSGSTWVGGRVPAPGDDVVIPAGSTVTADGDKTARDITINGTLFVADLDGNHEITATGKITIGGTVTGAKGVSAGGTITVTGTGKIKTPAEDGTKVEAGGDINVATGGTIEPGSTRVPEGKPGKPTTIKSGGTITVDGGIEGLPGGGGSPPREGGPAPKGAEGGGVTVEGKELKGTGTIKGGQGGASDGGKGKNGPVDTKGIKDNKFKGTIARIAGGSIEFLGTALVQLTELAAGAITAESGSVIIGTEPGGYVDLRGNGLRSNIIVAAESIIIETDSLLLDPGVPLSRLTSPPAIVRPARPFPPRLLVQRQGEELFVCWNSSSNIAYQLQYTLDLASGLWSDLATTVRGDGSAICIRDSLRSHQPQRYYRVLATR